MSTITPPLVSVCMITYNHEKYIAQTIESVLMQKTSFPIELIIGEDCSTDNTRAICIEYQKKYPEIIRLLLPETNVGMMENFIKVLRASIGKYIALCEGDDYWIDPYKLQKQVDFLENNGEFIACYHNARIINTQNKITLFNSLDENHFPSTEDIINKRWFIATASLVFRNSIIELPGWMNTVVNGDYALELLLANKGKLYYMDDVMSVYRQHESSVSFELNKKKVFLYDKLIELYKNVFEIYPEKYNKTITERIIFFENEIRKEQRLLSYPFLEYVDWRYHKRKLFKFLKIKRDKSCN